MHRPMTNQRTKSRSQGPRGPMLRLHLSKMQRSALASGNALLLGAVEMHAGCTTHHRLSLVVEEPWQRAEREHESFYASTHVPSASAHPVEE